MENSNLSHRMDVRTQTEFSRDIRMGVTLQEKVASIVEDQCRHSCVLVKRGFKGIDVDSNKNIHAGNYVDTGDGSFIFDDQEFEVEFKTKEIDSQKFSLKEEDLKRCVNQGKPIIMANRMCTWRDDGLGSFLLDGRKYFWNKDMKIRCMDLPEIRRILSYPAKKLEHMGNKMGYVFRDELDWDDWISIGEIAPRVIFACYQKCFPRLFPYKGREYSWELTLKAMEAHRDSTFSR